MSKYLFFVFFSFLLLHDCKSSSHSTESKTEIVGVWVSDFDRHKKIEFTEDGYYNAYSRREGKKEFVFFEEVNGTYLEVDYGKMVYHIDQRGDSLFVDLIGVKNNQKYAKRLFFIVGNSLIEVVYKEGENIDNHIQVVYQYYKEGTTKVELKDKPKWKLALPKQFDKRDIYIAFGQKSGTTITTEAKEVFEFNVPSSGLLKLKEVEDILLITNGNIEFFWADENGNSTERINVLKSKDIFRLIDEGKNPTTKPLDIVFPPDSKVVLATSRFNPRRKDIDKLFAEPILGNVIAFEIVTLRTKLLSWGIDLNEVEFIYNK